MRDDSSSGLDSRIHKDEEYIIFSVLLVAIVSTMLDFGNMFKLLSTKPHSAHKSFVDFHSASMVSAI